MNERMEIGRLRMRKIRNFEEFESSQIASDLGYIKDGAINGILLIIDGLSLKLNNLISKTRNLKESQNISTNLKQSRVIK